MIIRYRKVFSRVFFVFTFATFAFSALGKDFGLLQKGGVFFESIHTLSLDQNLQNGKSLVQDHNHGLVKPSQHESHGPDTSALFFVIMAIIIGAATRHFLKKLPFPFTVLLLLIGIVLGVMDRGGLFDHWGTIDVGFIKNSLDWAANIDPHMLLYVFLPVLIFEAAFAMDLHVFKKTATNSTLLAVPGILLSLFLTAGVVILMGYFDVGLVSWGWPVALMFGAVISATDPVAVVALLKDLGASKKLGTLIEGESLLNDGTAIVLFMVFFTAISGDASGNNGFVEFVRVSFGGILVGVAVGAVLMRWVKKVFNDALVEISIVIAAAYLTFYIAEHFFHVSGVLALVVLGLNVGGFGRSSISPQVEHFMHEFWDLAGFIANSMIFLIVGIVVATRSVFSLEDFFLLGIVYLAIHLVRGVMILLLYPFLKRLGYGLPKKEAVILWYGALRGAIGLALALIVAGLDDAVLSEEIKNEFLFLIAGTVTLTLLVNATTIKYLVDYLGLTKLAPAKQQMIYNARHYLRQSVENQTSRISSDRYFKKTDWQMVEDFLPKSPEELALSDQQEASTVAESRRRLLEKEKSSYWYQFKEGLIGASSVQKLSDGINKILDSNGEISLSERDDLEESWEAPKWLIAMRKIPIVKIWVEKNLLERLTNSYDCAVGFIHSQEECLTLLESIARSGEVKASDIALLESEINENKIHGQTFIRNLRKNHPEIYGAISTRQAIRTLLNYEYRTIERLLKKGRIDSSEAERLYASWKQRTKKLVDSPPGPEYRSEDNG